MYRCSYGSASPRTERRTIHPLLHELHGLLRQMQPKTHTRPDTKSEARRLRNRNPAQIRLNPVQESRESLLSRHQRVAKDDQPRLRGDQWFKARTAHRLSLLHQRPAPALPAWLCLWQECRKGNLYIYMHTIDVNPLTSVYKNRNMYTIVFILYYIIMLIL